MESIRTYHCTGNTLEDTQGYRCKMTVANGVIVWRD